MVVDTGFSNTITHTKAIEAALNGYRRTLIPLGTIAPIKAYHFALDSGGTDPVVGLTADEWLEQVESVFFEIAKADNSYTQLRYVNAEGYEVARVDSLDGVPEVASKEKLQYKGDRYCFEEGSKLSLGEVYVSCIELNRAGDPPQIQQPLHPNLRFITPVISLDGSRDGLVVTSVHTNKIFETLNHNEGRFSAHLEEVFIVDSDGYYLWHRDKSKTFGGPQDLDTGENLRNDYPKIANKILSGEAAAYASDEKLIAHAPIYPYNDNDRKYWVVVEIAPKDTALEFLEVLKSSLYTVTFGFIATLAVIFFILAQIAALAIKDVRKDIKTVTKLK